ncbi:hypothetical protein D3C76_25800 [compost metagenome]
MTEQIKLFDVVTIYDAAEVLTTAPAHGQHVNVPIPDTANLPVEEVYELLPPGPLLIFSTWPKRKWAQLKVGDIYDRLRPRQVGVFEIGGLVNGNEGWVLHGRVYYLDGVKTNHLRLTPPHLVVLSVDIERGDPSQGRRAFQLDRILVSPK